MVDAIRLRRYILDEYLIVYKFEKSMGENEQRRPSIIMMVNAEDKHQQLLQPFKTQSLASSLMPVPFMTA